MASQSLYRKWRSQTFDDIVGQEAVITTLKNQFTTGELRHAYLFTGPRGTGKTSMARLLAKTVNCLQPRNGEPCNECLQCKEITVGSSFNVLEIDAASNRGIDSIRDLREKVMMPPSTGKYKVYILDEAHMLTTEAFNALLKTLEEPPPYAIFVLATTDVHKLLPTVLSRCQRFDFKRFTLKQLVDRLHFVATQEKVELQPGSAELIARAAAGGMRDALSLLDQAIAYSGRVISLEQVQAMLGVADPRAIQKFVLFIANLDSPGGLHLIHELSESGADLRQINTQIAEYWRAMMLAKAGANIAEILDNTANEIREILQTAQYFELEELTECARIFAQNDFMQKSLSTPQLGLELALLACVAVHRRGGEGHAQPSREGVSASRLVMAPAIHGAAQAGTVNASPSAMDNERYHQSISGEMGSRSEVHIPAEPGASVAPETQAVPASVRENTQRREQEVRTVSMLGPTITLSMDAAPPVVVSPVSSQPAVRDGEGSTSMIASLATDVSSDDSAASDNLPTLSIQDVKEKWEYIRRRVKTRKDGAKIAALLSGYTILGVEGTIELPVVICKASADFHYKTLHDNEVYYETIRWALKVTLDMECDIRLLPPHTNYNPTGASRIIPPPSNPGNGNTVRVPVAASSSTMAPIQLNPTASAQVVEGSALAQVAAKPAEIDRPAVVPPTPAIVPPSPSSVIESLQEPEWLQTEFLEASPVVEHREEQGTSSSSLARNGVVRENTTEIVVAGNTHLEEIKKHAMSNPVVSEVQRLFKAEIKDIQPK